MIMLFESGNDPSGKVDKLLNFVQLTPGRPTPHAQAVRDMWEHIRLDDNFEGFCGEVMPNFVQRDENTVTFFGDT